MSQLIACLVQFLRKDMHNIFCLSYNRTKYSIGDEVRDPSWRYKGVVAYVGPTYFHSGTWVGLLLSSPSGLNDGSVKGVQYFSCAPKRGVFLKHENVRITKHSISTIAQLAALGTLIDVTINEQPQDQNKVIGEDVSFSITASGPGILSYQWMKDGNSINNENEPFYSGIDANVLNIKGVQHIHAGRYYCEVRNDNGHPNSIVASNTVELRGIFGDAMYNI